MTKELIKFLELERADNSERNKIVATLPKELAYFDFEGKPYDKPARELLLSEAIESTTLIQTEVYRTVAEGSEPAKCWENHIQTVDIKGNAWTWVYGETGTYAGKVAEGGEIPIDTQDYSSKTFTCVKRGVRPLITRELVEDGLFSIVDLELRKAGLRLQNAIEQECLNEMLLDSGSNFDTATTAGAMGSKAVVGAMMQLEGYGFHGTDIVMCPGFAAYVFNDYVPALYSGSPGMPVMGAPGAKLTSILGLSAGICNVTYSAGTYYWAYTTNDYAGALVFDKSAAGGLVFARRPNVEQYVDPIHDLVGCSVTARFDADSLLPYAIVRIGY